MDSAFGLLATLSFSSSIVYTAVPKEIFFTEQNWSTTEIQTSCVYIFRRLGEKNWYLDGGRGHLAGLVEVQRDDLGEAACI